ncbi:TEX15 [Branchiostoma lanceolatum]|uniref:TEX15 protein n=2 Tax=Branchiostoma lanceolatum TaxID=7740 RepID=A0A8J9Z2Q2_BRALA|nr:TEX15 [Branchiostoma lanceolatum]
MAASSHGGRRCALPVKKRQSARKVKMKDNMLRPVSLDSHEAQEIQFACRRTCWDEKNFEYQISDIQLVENDFLQSEFLQKQHELSIEGRSPKELIEEFAFLDVTDKTKRSTVCNSGLTTSLSDTSNSALGEPSQGVTVWRCPDLCIQKETEGGPKNAVVAMFKIMRGRPRTVVPQSNLGLPPKPVQHFDSHVPCVVFSGTDDMTSAMQIYLYELNKVDHRPLSRPRHCCPYAIIHFNNKSCQDVTSAKTVKVAKISKPVASVTKQQQPASGRRLIPFGDKMVTYSIAWTGTLTNKDKELGRVDFLAGQGCKVPSLGTKVLRVTTKMGLPSLKDVLPPQCLKNVGSAWDKRLRHESWRYNVLVVRPVQDSRDTMARFCAFLRQSNSATVTTLLVSGAPAPVKLFLMPSCKFTEDLGLGASSDHGKMFAILSYKVLPPSSAHSKQKNKKISKEKTGKPLTEKQPCSPDYMDIDFPHDEYDVGDQVPSLVDSFNTNVFTSVFNLEKPAQKKTDPNIENNQGKGSAITEAPQAGSKVKESSTQQPFRDISSGAIPNTEGRGRRNGVLEQSNFGDDASIGSHRTVDSTSLMLNPVGNAIPVDPRLARRRQPSSESNTSSIENRTPPMETPQSPDSISMMSIPERDFLDRGQSTVSHISSGKDLDLTSGSIQKVEVVDRPENPLVRKSPNAVVTTKDEDSTQKQALDETVQSSNEVMKTSVKPSTLAFLPKKRPVRGIFAHLKNKGPAHVETASLHLDNDLETVDLATTQRPRRSGIPFGSALKITVKNQNVIKEKTTECSTEEKMIKKLKTDDNHSHAVEDTQMLKLSPTKQSLGDNYDDVLMELDSDTNEPEGETQEERDRTEKCKAVQQQNGDIGTTEKVKGESNTWKQNREQNGENHTTGKDRSTCKQIKEKNGETDTIKEADAREKKTDTEQAGKLIVPTHHRYNRGDSFYRANLIRNPWLDDNDELMRYRHVVPKGATNISPPRKGAMKENGGEKDDNNQQENVQHQGQRQHKAENGSVELETNHSHGHPTSSSNHKAAKGTGEHNSKEACSSSKVLKQEHVKDTQKKVAEDATGGVQENTMPDAQQKDARSREQRPKSSSSSRTFSRSRSKSKSSSVCRTRSRSRSLSRGRSATRSRSRRNRTNKSASRSPRRSPRRRRSRSRSRLRNRSSSKSKDSPQGAMSNAKSIPRARRSGISVPSIGQNVFAGFHMNINSPYRRKRPECRKRSSSSSSSSSSERPRPVYRGRYDQVDRNRRSQVRRNKTKRRCRSSDKRSSRDEDSSGSSLDRRSKRQRRLRSNRSSERNDQQDVNKSDVSRAEQGNEEKHNADSKGKSMKTANPSSPGKKCMEKGGGDSNHCREEKKPMPNERIELVERILFLTTGNVEKFNHSDRVHKHLFHLGIECLKQEAKRLARNKGLGEDWLEEEFLPKHDDGESPDQNFIDKHTSTMTRDDLVREILQLRKELNLTMGNHSNIRKMERKELIASLEELRTSKREILVTSSAAGMTKASGAYMVRREDAKMGCEENPMRSVPQRKGDAFVKAVKDFVTYNKSMWLPSNTDIEEETQKQLVRKTSDDLPAEAALNLPQEFQADSKYHLDVHLVAMQKSNTKSESRNEALKKEMQVDVMMARSFEDRGTIQDRAVKVEAVVAKERGPQTLPDAMPVKQAWSAPQPISPTPRNLAMQCSHIPPGGITQAAFATGVPEDTLKKAPMMASHREKCLDCSAQPEQTPVKMAEQHQGKPASANIVATSDGKDCVPMDPRLSSTVQQEFGDVTGSSQGADNGEISQGRVVGSAAYVRRNLLENELSDAVVGLGKDHGADFSPCDTTSGSSENSPEESQLVPPRGDGGLPDGVVIPTKEQGIGPVSPEGSDRELYQEKDMNPDRGFNSKSQPEKSSVRNDNNQIPPAAWRANVVVDYNSNCMQDKVPMFLREKVGLRSHSYPAQQPEWGQRFQEQASGHRYGPPPGRHCDIKASAVFPRPGGHQHGGVGPGQFQKPGPPHAHPPPRMPYCFQQQAPSRHPHPSPPRRLPPPHSPSRPPHPSPPNRLPPPHSPSRPPHPAPPNRLPPPHSPSRPPQPSPPRRPPPSHYPPQQSPPSRHPLSPCRPPPLSPRRGCGQTPPRPLMSNIPPRSYHGPPQHSSTSGFASTGQYNKDTEVNSNYRSNFPHSSAGGFTTAGQYNKDTEVNNNNNYRSDFQQDDSGRPLVLPSYPTQGRGIVRGCPRGGGRGQPFPNPGRGRAGQASLGGYANRGGYPQRGRGGFGGRGFMAGTVQGRGRAQPAW